MSRQRRRLVFLLFFSAVAAGLAVAATAATSPSTWTDDLSPIAARDWNVERAAHLLERAGFGGTPEEIERLAPLTPQQAVDSLVDYESIDNSGVQAVRGIGHLGSRAWIRFPPSRAEAVRLARERGDALGVQVLPAGSPRRLQPVVDKFFYGLRANSIETQRLGVWWANRMLTTTRPLEEKLTLFWHGHFATGDAKVRDYRMMLRQNEMLRANAGGRAARPARRASSRIRRCSSISTTARTSRSTRTRTSAASCSSCSRWASATTRSATCARPRAPSPAGRTTSSRSSSTASSTTSARRRSSAGPDRSTARTSSTRFSTQPVTAEFVAAKMYRYFVRDEISPAVKSGARPRRSGRAATR